MEQSNSINATGQKEQPLVLQRDQGTPCTTKKCTQCQDWVTVALSNVKSRPRQLLSAMGFRAVRDEATGNFSVSATSSSTSPAPLKEAPALRWRISSSGGVPSQQPTESSNNSADVPSCSRALMASSVEAKEDQQHQHRLGHTANSNAVSHHRNDNDGNNAIVTTPSKFNKNKMQMEILCTTCSDEGPEGAARAYVKGPNPLCVVLCANRLSSKEEVEEALVHELIHVYDVRVRDMDLRCELL